MNTAKALLFHEYPEGHEPQVVDTQKRFKSMTDGSVIEYEPLDSPTKRDCHKIWQFVIAEEEKLRERGYGEGLIIGPHNFDRLLSRALGNQAFKCLVVLMQFYDERLRGQDLPIDLVKLFARGMTVYRAPVNIVLKLYKFVKPREENQSLTMPEIRSLILAFCATKVTLIDVMPEEVLPPGTV